MILSFIRLKSISLHKHHEIDWHICNLTFLIDLSFIGNDCSCMDIVLRILQKIVERTMLRVILTRFALYRMGTHRSVVINQIVNLALLAVVVIEEFVSMCAKLLGHHILIDGTKIDTADIVENRTDVIAIEYASKEFYFHTLCSLASRVFSMSDSL